VPVTAVEFDPTLPPLKPVSALQTWPNESVNAGPPAFTLIAVNGGGGPFTVNATALLLPVAPLTVIFAAPETALTLMENVAVICVELTTATFEMATSGLLDATLEPATKLNPATVTPKVAPKEPALGLTDVIYGVAASTVVEPTLFTPP